MNNVKTTAISGCVIWFLLISIIASCAMPVFFLAGSLSSFSETSINLTGKWLCPKGTTPHRNVYSTTSLDEFGNPEPATAYELQCMDSNGTVVKTDPVFYSFLWIGIWAGLGLTFSVVLTMIFAVPGGMLVTKLLEKLRKPRSDVNQANLK